MKRTLALSLILAALLSPLSAAEWNSSTTGDQTVAENVTVTGTANVGSITFTGDSVVSGTGSIGGSGNITVNSGNVVFDGVSRPGSKGNITIAAGATLEIKNGAKILESSGHNASSVVTVNGTLKVQNLNYGGSLGNLHDNVGVSGYTESFVVNGGGRVEITETGSASIGARLNGWGQYFTFAVADGKDFSWVASGNGNVVASDHAGSVLVLEAGVGATFKLGKNIGTGLTVQKSGAGTLVLNSTLNLDEGRRIDISSGTVKFGDNARITSAGDGFFVGTDAIMDLEGKAGISGQAVTVNGSVINGQNNGMNLRLSRTGTFSISGDATAGYQGTVVLTDGAKADLGDYIFYNTIDISAGGTLQNAVNHRGTVVLGADDEGMTYLDSDTLSVYGGGLATAGSMAVEITQDFVSEVSGYELLKGRMYAEDSVSIAGSGEENLTIDGYTTAYGAVSAQNGDISIADVNDVTLSNNAASNEMMEDYHRAGALSAAGSVSIEAAGEVSISGNSAAVQSSAAGAVWAGSGDVTITGAGISISGNSATDGACSGGAIRSDWGATYLTSTEGNVEISANTADESGGAIYAVSGVEITSAANIVIADNSAVSGDGGAVYSEGDVTLTPGASSSVSISGNEAGGSGGAIYSYGTVYISGGTVEISDNHAGGYGGAIYAENVVIAADAGNVTFSNNTHDGGTANDVELWSGAASLSATNGHTLEMQGGVTCASEINISTDEESTVKLGGTSSTENLTIEDGRVHGIYDADGNQAVICVSTSVTLSNACLQDVALLDEYNEAALTSSASTYVYNDAVGMLFETLDDGSVNCTSCAPLLNGFATVKGDLTIGLTLDFLTTALAEADGNALNITLCLLDSTTSIAEDGSFTFSLSEDVASWLDASELVEYGFYDADGNQLGVNEVEMVEGGAVVFAVSGITDIIPEPATTTLSLLALSALCLRRRRQK